MSTTFETLWRSGRLGVMVTAQINLENTDRARNAVIARGTGKVTSDDVENVDLWLNDSKKTLVAFEVMD